MKEVNLPSCFLINRYIYFLGLLYVLKLFIIWVIRGIITQFRFLTILRTFWTLLLLRNFHFFRTVFIHIFALAKSLSLLFLEWSICKMQESSFIDVLVSTCDKYSVIWVNDTITFLLVGVAGQNFEKSWVLWVIT